jgi:hypothetical protein
VTRALPIAVERRLTLFPHGQVLEPDHRDRCAELALWCGADLERFIDAPVLSADAFARYVGRIAAVRRTQALVVLTKTNPLALMVVESRRRLERLLPELRMSRWMIYLDRKSDPFFMATATRLGHLTGQIDEAPIWVGPGDAPYLVLDSEMRDREFVRQAIAELDTLILAESGEWPR